MGKSEDNSICFLLQMIWSFAMRPKGIGFFESLIILLIFIPLLLILDQFCQVGNVHFQCVISKYHLRNCLNCSFTISFVPLF